MQDRDSSERSKQDQDRHPNQESRTGQSNKGSQSDQLEDNEQLRSETLIALR
jgi:hypothetical protein